MCFHHRLVTLLPSPSSLSAYIPFNQRKHRRIISPRPVFIKTRRRNSPVRHPRIQNKQVKLQSINPSRWKRATRVSPRVGGAHAETDGNARVKISGSSFSPVRIVRALTGNAATDSFGSYPSQTPPGYNPFELHPSTWRPTPATTHFYQLPPPSRDRAPVKGWPATPTVPALGTVSKFFLPSVVTSALLRRWRWWWFGSLIWRRWCGVQWRRERDLKGKWREIIVNFYEVELYLIWKISRESIEWNFCASFLGKLIGYTWNTFG